MPGMDSFVSLLASQYLTIKFIHLLFATLWLWSTAVAYINYVIPALRRWMADPENAVLTRERNLALERFDQGVLLEHIAFPLVLVSGLGLLMAGGWGVSHYWLVLKLGVVILIFLPIECLDYWLSHFGGNKRKARLAAGQNGWSSPRYEQLIHYHIWFLLVTTPVIVTGGIAVVYLATVKPF